MSTSEDEYDNQLGGAIKLSEEDCAKLDEQSSNILEPRTTRREPVTHINLELETPETPIQPSVENIVTSLPVTSPFQRYRQRGRLSVTDLVAPAWQVYSNIALGVPFTGRLGVKFNLNTGSNSNGQKD